jgi:hypothetical protein
VATSTIETANCVSSCESRKLAKSPTSMILASTWPLRPNQVSWPSVGNPRLWASTPVAETEKLPRCVLVPPTVSAIDCGSPVTRSAAASNG